MTCGMVIVNTANGSWWILMEEGMYPRVHSFPLLPNQFREK
jgi:hypothetical protein